MVMMAQLLDTKDLADLDEKELRLLAAALEGELVKDAALLKRLREFVKTYHKDRVSKRGKASGS